MDDAKREEHSGSITLGAFGAFLRHHGDFCEAYIPRDRQRSNGPQRGICCYSLVSSDDYHLRVESGSNHCCGIRDRLLVCFGAQDVGYIECHEASWLIPLLKRKLVNVSVSTGGCLVHPIGGEPPLCVEVSSEHPQRITEALNGSEPALINCVSSMFKHLGCDETQWMESHVYYNSEEIEKLTKGRSFPGKPCTCTNDCFQLRNPGRGGYRAHQCKPEGYEEEDEDIDEDEDEDE